MTNAVLAVLSVATVAGIGYFWYWLWGAVSHEAWFAYLALAAYVDMRSALRRIADAAEKVRP